MSLISRRTFVRTSLAAAAGCVGYGWGIEPHWVERVVRPLPIRGLPKALDGATLLQISDVHVGPKVDSTFVIDAFRDAAALKPDFVVFTGDAITYTDAKDLREARRVFETMPRGRLSTVAVLGNHDYGFGWNQPEVADRIERILDASGALVLRNDAAELHGLRFTGIDDFWSGRLTPERVAPLLEREGPGIVLCHNPDAADLSIFEKYDGWILSGHTHGGQCRPPFLPPPVLPVRNKRYTAGEFALAGGGRLYINRGLGHLWRVRFNVRPEVTQFVLRTT
ncbi:MAG TPA: metallophosphoesterase [Candidatus Polarisedimenticolaceae bacterium]